jgi:cytochrome c peroxidase
MTPRTRYNCAIVVALAVLVAAGVVKVNAQLPDLPKPLETLKGHVPPDPPNLGEFVRDRNAAVALGKALFWDMQAGSDEQTACATCHFAAGADLRARGRLNPGPDAFDRTLSTREVSAALAPTGANYALNPEDFPFHVLSDPADRDSPIVFSSNDVLGSQGQFPAVFGGIGPDGREILTPIASTVFRIGSAANLATARKVTNRHSPTVINAAFNHRNFWDGRANSVFNGVNSFGPRDPSATVWVNRWNGTCWVLMPERIALLYSAAASQAVAPIVSDTEMSATKRKFPDVGRKLLPRRPLALQRVDPSDSVLGSLVHESGLGLSVTYRELVQQAFWPQWWNSDQTLPLSDYSHMEGNFSLFWGLAIQMYESTLISDDSPVDRFIQGSGGLHADEQAGMGVFQAKGCDDCHSGPEFTIAGRTEFIEAEVGGLLELMDQGVGNAALYDAAFYNLGIRPTSDDILNGGLDPFGNPLSFTRQAKRVMAGGTQVDDFFVDTCTFELGPCNPLMDPNTRDAIDGGAKTPTLRNVELTAPYFHTGGYATLEQVVDFYSRGGNVRRNASGTGDNSGLLYPSNFVANMIPLNFTPDEKRQLVAFLKALTDPRVRNESAPFDHPALRLHDGHPGDSSSTPIDGSGRALDRWIEIPAVGAGGRSAAGLPALTDWTPPPAKPRVNGLVAAYSFDAGEAPGADDSAKENHGTIAGAAWQPAGRFGGALSFDGVDDMMSALSSASLALTNRFTLEAWVKPSVTGGAVFAKENASGLDYALYAGNTQALPAALARVGTAEKSVAGPAALPAGQWSHLAATYDGTNLRLYVNSVLVRTTAMSGTLSTSALPLRIGGSTVRGELFRGLVDEVRIYNRALTAAQIAADMNSGIR